MAKVNKFTPSIPAPVLAAPPIEETSIVEVPTIEATPVVEVTPVEPAFRVLDRPVKTYKNTLVDDISGIQYEANTVYPAVQVTNRVMGWLSSGEMSVDFR